MQLALTILSDNHAPFIAELLPTIRDCKCNVLEIRSSRLAQAAAAYLLVEGNWNQIAKLENALDALQRRLEVKIHWSRPELRERISECVPYTLETISVDKANIIESVTSFLFDRDIAIEEMSASSYLAPFAQTPVFSSKLVILIPPHLNLLSLREEFLDFCDQLNIDAILEPIKR